MDELLNYVASHEFTKECLLVFLSVILGGICTVYINRGAMRKQCAFNMIYDALRGLLEDCNSVQQKVEELEISLSFGNRCTAVYSEQISMLEKMMFNLNKNMEKNKPFCHKYLKSMAIERSAEAISLYHSSMYAIGSNGIIDMKLVDKVNAEGINKLRAVTHEYRKIGADLMKSLEQLIEPGIINCFRIKIRKISTFFGRCMAIIRIK